MQDHNESGVEIENEAVNPSHLREHCNLTKKKLPIADIEKPEKRQVIYLNVFLNACNLREDGVCLGFRITTSSSDATRNLTNDFPSKIESAIEYDRRRVK